MENRILIKLTESQLASHNILPEDVETIGVWYEEFVKGQFETDEHNINVVTKLDMVEDKPTIVTTIYKDMVKNVEMSNTYTACVQVKADVEKENNDEISE